jgi:hypothetical protein
LFGEEAAQRASGQAHDFERALDALGIGGLEAGRGVRVEACQFGVQRRPALRCGLGVDRGAQRSGSACGSSARPSRRALTYSMVPPTSSGMRPAAVMSAISRRASLRNAAAE